MNYCGTRLALMALNDAFVFNYFLLLLSAFETQHSANSEPTLGLTLCQHFS